MPNNIDDFLRLMQDGAIRALEKVHQGTEVALEAVQKTANVSVGAINKSAAAALGAVQRSASVSIEAIDLLAEMKGHPQAILNGVIGDTLEAQKSKLAIQMSLIGNPETGRLCIFVHGLCASESLWQFVDDTRKSYGSLLKKDCGYSPIFVRYNSGLRISTNGQLLAGQISEFCKSLPDPINEIIFVGHSMGGLVVRSACHYAQKKKTPWVKKVKKIFLLGTPHHGNDYEKLGNLTTTILKLVPNLVTIGLAKLGDKRSTGIKDLRFGNLLDEDWQGHNPDALLKDNRHAVALLEGANYYLIAGSLARESDNIFTQYFGDGMISTHAAAGRSFRKSKTIPFLHSHFKVIKGVSHTNLTRNPEVYQQIKKWCQE